MFEDLKLFCLDCVGLARAMDAGARDQWWLAALGTGAGAVLLRSVVPAVLCLGSSACSPQVKGGALAFPFLCFGTALCFGYPVGQLSILCASMVYFALLGFAVHALGGALRVNVTPMASFISAIVAFVLLPGVLFPDEQVSLVRLLGFEIALSAHSYLIEVQGRGDAWRRRDALFFLLVNPVLVLPERGERSQHRQTLARVFGRLTGGSAVLIGSSFVTAAYDGLALANHFGADFFPKLVTEATALIMLHSGSASVQIAWMRGLGWEVPERYEWPLLARDPQQFWQRWNTYFGSWLRRYVFVPMHLTLRRRYRAAPTSSSLASAVLGTFVCNGLLHDLCGYPGSFEWRPVWTPMFGGVGLLLVMWVMVQKGLEQRSQARVARWFNIFVGRALVPTQIVFAGWLLSSDFEAFWVAALGDLIVVGGW